MVAKKGNHKKFGYCFYCRRHMQVFPLVDCDREVHVYFCYRHGVKFNTDELLKFNQKPDKKTKKR